jgi:hypothetical protein
MMQYITMTKLAAMCGISRTVMAKRLIQLRLCHDAHTPTEEALRKGLCRVRPTWGNNVMVLWHWQKTIAALAAGHSPASGGKEMEQTRRALRNSIAAARQTMQWGEIVEVVIAMKAEEQGIQARVI